MTIVARPDIVSQIGNTPLVELNSFSTSSVKLFAKLRMVQPFWLSQRQSGILDGKGCGEERTVKERQKHYN